MPLSGGGAIKGDVLSRYTLAECKTSHLVDARGEKEMKLQKSWLTKAEKEAAAEGRPWAVVEIRFKGDQTSWTLMKTERLLALLAENAAYRDQERS